MLDNEAQLAYVLSHEVAHMERQHFYKVLQTQVVEPAYNVQRQKSAAKKAGIFTAIGAAAGGIAGGAAQGWGGAAQWAALGGIGGLAAGGIYGAFTSAKNPSTGRMNGREMRMLLHWSDRWRKITTSAKRRNSWCRWSSMFERIHERGSGSTAARPTLTFASSTSNRCCRARSRQSLSLSRD